MDLLSSDFNWLLLTSVMVTTHFSYFALHVLVYRTSIKFTSVLLETSLLGRCFCLKLNTDTHVHGLVNKKEQTLYRIPSKLVSFRMTIFLSRYFDLAVEELIVV